MFSKALFFQVVNSQDCVKYRVNNIILNHDYISIDFYHNRFKGYASMLTLYHEMTSFDALEQKSLLKKILGKEENAGDQHFLLFPQCFLYYERQLNILSNI